MTTIDRYVIKDVDPELDRLVNDEGMCQLKASQRLYAPGIEFPIRHAASTGQQVAEFTHDLGVQLTERQRAFLDAVYAEPAPVAALPVHQERPPAGRWHFADVLRWLTGGRRP